MPELSPVAYLCWQVAGLEARRAGAARIGVDHLLVGLLSLEKLLEPASGVDAARRELVRPEQAALSALLQACGLQAAVVRREVRRRWPQGPRPTEGVMSRDDLARAAFGRADALAQLLGSPSYGPLHLLAVLLEQPSASLLASLPAASGRATIERLRLAVLARLGPPSTPVGTDTSGVWVPPVEPQTSDQPYPGFEFSPPTPGPHEMPKSFPVDGPSAGVAADPRLGPLDGPLSGQATGLPEGSPGQANGSPSRHTPVPSGEPRLDPADGAPPIAGNAKPVAGDPAGVAGSRGEDAGGRKADAGGRPSDAGDGAPAAGEAAAGGGDLPPVATDSPSEARVAGDVRPAGEVGVAGEARAAGEVRAVGEALERSGAGRTRATPAVLLRFGRDLTAEAAAGRLGPVVGRRDEMLQVVWVLNRRTKNTPVLIGEAGVGKTAVVEGLACRIAEGAVLPGRRIVALSLASVVAGTSYRGQFEERIEEILTALRSRPDIILFLDELHTIVGAGDQDGRMDAANLLKPALARGEIACIGATTTDEYQRHIASDPALERRFQPVTVAEPTAAEARTILDGLRADLERHHGVRIEPSALDAAVELTVRYLPGRRLPDKAVDALDEACARASVPSLSPHGQHLGMAGAGAGSAVVSRETIGEVVSAWTGIPVGRIGQAEAERLADLETRLAERVIGQSEAIRQVAGRVRLARTGMTDPERPVGVFLFVGPSGVGKTALVQALAETALDGQQRLIRLDMSEYGEKHTVARLIGAPPGFQGYGDEGLLTGALRRSPHTIVLLDEAEKAHPEVFDVFLQLFDAGRLTDSSGRTVDGRQAIFVLTSNAGGGAGRRAIGFGQGGGDAAGRNGPSTGSGTPSAVFSSGVQREALLTELRQFFRPELLNRIDEIVPFRPLGETELEAIAERQVQALRRRLMDAHELDLVVTPMALTFLARLSAAESGGARAVQRTLTRLIERPLSRDLLNGEYLRGEYLLAEVSGDGIVLVRDTRTI